MAFEATRLGPGARLVERRATRPPFYSTTTQRSRQRLMLQAAVQALPKVWNTR
jgi:hypothetical protein